MHSSKLEKRQAEKEFKLIFIPDASFRENLVREVEYGPTALCGGLAIFLSPQPPLTPIYTPSTHLLLGGLSEYPRMRESLGRVLDLLHSRSAMQPIY